MIKSAILSPCGSYRYDLVRQWDDTLPRLQIIMLNPSTADANIDDPTIRRCISFARRDGYGGIRVVNLHAWRTPYPDAMPPPGMSRNGPNNHDAWVATFAYAAAYPCPCWQRGARMVTDRRR